MPLEPENYLLMDARRKEEKIKGSHWKGESRKNGNYLIRALDICLSFFFAIPTLLILPLFFLQSVRSFFITLSAEVQIG